MDKGEIGNFLKGINNKIPMKCLHYRVGECLIISVPSFNRWNLLYYQNTNRTSNSGRTTYGKYEGSIQKGGKGGLKVPFPIDMEFNEENVCRVLLNNGLDSEAKSFNNLNIYLAKWQEEKIKAETKAKVEADLKVKARLEDEKAEARKKELTNPEIGSVWRPIKPVYINTGKIPENVTMTIMGKHPTDYMAHIVKLSNGVEEEKVYLFGFHGYFLEKFERIS